MCACVRGSLERSWRACSVRCSLNGRFMNGYSCVIILFWKNEGLKIVKMLNKRTNVRTCVVPISRR